MFIFWFCNSILPLKYSNVRHQNDPGSYFQFVNLQLYALLQMLAGGPYSTRFNHLLGKTGIHLYFWQGIFKE